MLSTLSWTNNGSFTENWTYHKKKNFLNNETNLIVYENEVITSRSSMSH